MRKHLPLTFLLGLIMALSFTSVMTAAATDISGTWNFSVDLAGGGHGDPTFVFKQEGEKLTGTYNGPLGDQKVTGTLNGDKAVFGFEFTNDGQTVKATYTGKVESPTKMTGTVQFGGEEQGKWTATKKE
jgi:hypothetical protein